MASQLIKTLRALKGKDPPGTNPKGENQLQKTVKSLKGQK